MVCEVPLTSCSLKHLICSCEPIKIAIMEKEQTALTTRNEMVKRKLYAVVIEGAESGDYCVAPVGQNKEHAMLIAGALNGLFGNKDPDAWQKRETTDAPS